MSLSIRQEANYAGADRWKWSVWIDGQPDELDEIDHVTYVLDPTFHNPVREVRDRTSKFRLDTASWGTFTILAKASYKDGHDVVLEHDLELLYPDGTPTAA